MRIRGHQEMSIPPNKLPLDRKVLLTKSLNIGTTMSEAVFMPPTPTNMKKNKGIQDEPREIIILDDESIGSLQSQGDYSGGRACSKPHEGKVNGISVPRQEIQEHVERENQSIDLNKTPQQKPRRKIHRPKVIREGKPFRTPTPSTANPVTPRTEINEGTPSGKRKYGRKQVLNLDNPSDQLGEIADPNIRTGTKSVRRCLNFDSEEPQSCMGLSSRFPHNAKDQAQGLYMKGNTSSSCVKSAQRQEVVAGITFDLHSSSNQTSDGYTQISEIPMPPPQPFTRKMRASYMLNGYLRVSKPSPTTSTPSRRETIRENMKELARKIAVNSNRSPKSVQKSQVDANNSPNVILSGTKRDHNLVDDAQIPALQSFTCAYNRINHISDSHDASRHSPHFPKAHKKMKTTEKNEFTSNASSSVTCRHSNCQMRPNSSHLFTSVDAQSPLPISWNTRMMVPNNNKVFTLADAERLMTLEKLRASESTLSYEQRNPRTDNSSKVQVCADNLTSQCVTKECVMSITVKSSIYNSMDSGHVSTPEKVTSCKNSQGSETFEPQTCTQAPSVNKTRTYNEDEFICSDTNTMHLQKCEAASYSYGFSGCQKPIKIIASPSVNVNDRNPIPRGSSLQQCESSSNFKESQCGNSQTGAIVSNGDPVDDIVRKLRYLNINAGHWIITPETKNDIVGHEIVTTEARNAIVDHEIVTVKAQNSIVPYGGGGGMVVPYEGPLDFTKKRHPRPKVDLDPETNRVWKLLMGKEDSDAEMGMNKEKWWEEERRIFHGRVDSFIARMHLVQGDRSFSRWKGSVVDSVVGVFLTQNVSDHLSSSAFMTLISRFPARPKGHNSKLDTEVQRDGSIIDLDDRIKRKEGYSKVKGLPLREKETGIAHESTDSTLIAKSEDRRSMTNEILSQHSVVSTQNSSEYLVQPVDQAKLGSSPYFHADDLLIGGIHNDLNSSISFMELLLMGEPRSFRELYGRGNGEISPTEFCGAVDQSTDKIGRRSSENASHCMDQPMRKNSPPNCRNEQETKFRQKIPGRQATDQDKMQNLGIQQTSLNSRSTSKGNSSTAAAKLPKAKAEPEKRDWDELRKQSFINGVKMERSRESMDSLDWESVRCADVKEISKLIEERGLNNILAERIKEFLNRVVEDHGSIDLEWLRNVPPDTVKDYLLSIRGLGLKSVECVRLLTLHHLAFPVDTNVGRICVRLGWVPLQPLPESLQLHLLEMYPMLDTIQKYIWPRLCKLDQRTLYELHYQMITFGKVFCTKSKPNCNACPMRGECKHFASAFASSRLALPRPVEKGLVRSAVPIPSTPVPNPIPLTRLEASTFSREEIAINNCEPIIEEPATPEIEYVETTEQDIEDAFYKDPDEIPHIRLNLEEFSQNIKSYMQEYNMELPDADMSKALVAIHPEVASIPMPKLKNVSQLRTEHQVYELPDSHPLLERLDQRETDDPTPYLLAIWSPGETTQSVEPRNACFYSEGTSQMCDEKTCFDCNSIQEAQAQTVRATLLIPCRTAMRGSFPLNGTYFQVNEVFADHDSSRSPIQVPREWIWNLPRRTVYFGTSVSAIFRGLTAERIQQCFWRGFVCVRGFDRTTRAPKPLYARLHVPASKVSRNRKKTTPGGEQK